MRAYRPTNHPNWADPDHTSCKDICIFILDHVANVAMIGASLYARKYCQQIKISRWPFTAVIMSKFKLLKPQQSHAFMYLLSTRKKKELFTTEAQEKLLNRILNSTQSREELLTEPKPLESKNSANRFDYLYLPLFNSFTIIKLMSIQKQATNALYKLYERP